MKASRPMARRPPVVSAPAVPAVPQAPVPWTARPDGLRVTVRVTPKAKRSAVAGVGAGADGRPALLVSVAAPPADGAANDAVVLLLADALRVGRSAITIVSGASSRHKIVDLRGNPDHLAKRLSAVLTAPEPG